MDVYALLRGPSLEHDALEGMPGAVLAVAVHVVNAGGIALEAEGELLGSAVAVVDEERLVGVERRAGVLIEVDVAVGAPAEGVDGAARLCLLQYLGGRGVYHGARQVAGVFQGIGRCRLREPVGARVPVYDDARVGGDVAFEPCGEHLLAFEADDVIHAEQVGVVGLVGDFHGEVEVERGQAHIADPHVEIVGRGVVGYAEDILDSRKGVNLAVCAEGLRAMRPFARAIGPLVGDLCAGQHLLDVVGIGGDALLHTCLEPLGDDARHAGC